MRVAAEGVGVPEAARIVIASVLNLELVLALLLTHGGVVSGNSAHVVGEAEILDLSPDESGILNGGVGLAVVTAFLHTFVPLAVDVTVAGSEVGVLKAAAEVADGEGRRVSVVVAAASGDGAFGAVHLRALQNTFVLEPLTFFRSAAFGSGRELSTIAAANGSEGIPEATRSGTTSKRSGSGELALEGALESSGAELADVAVGLADQRVADARASSDAEATDGIDSATRIVSLASFEIILVFHLTGLDACSRDTDPFASTTFIAGVLSGDTSALLDADVSNCVPST